MRSVRRAARVCLSQSRGLFAGALLSACVGSAVGPPGSAGGDGKTPTDNPTPPPRQPDTAPTTGPIASAPGPSSRFIRLSHAQWENTVRDLFRLTTPAGLSKQFVNEGLRADFDNQGGSAEVSSQLWFDYNKAATALATKIVRDPLALQKILPDGLAGDVEARGRAFIRGFGARAYRRPLTDAEIEQHLGLFRQGATLIASGDGFLDGAEMVVALMLQSPHFLYRTELGTPMGAGPLRLTDHEIAARLSYGLTSSMPDDQLLAAAAAGKVHGRDDVLAHAGRLLDSPAGQATLRDLHAQLLREVDPSELVRDPKLHPHFSAGIGADMWRESQTFADDVVYGQKRGLADLLTAPYTFVNARLAVLYGVSAPGATADKFVRVQLDDKRAGIFTQVGFLAMTATDFNSRPVKRGVTISRRVLCAEVPPPPVEVKSPTAPPITGKTNRQAFEAATEMPGTICISCHGKLINPLGFAFEKFDGMGEFRQDEKGLPVDARGSYDFAEGSRSFDGAADLMKIVAQGRQAHECYAGELFEYVYGHEHGPAEQGLIDELGRRSRLAVPVRNLLLDLVATDAFLTRTPD
jgi:hypothetical protein